MKLQVLLAIAVNALCISVMAQDTTPKFDNFCKELLQEKPRFENYEGTFTKEFRDQVPVELLLSIFQEMQKETGNCVSFKSQALNFRQYLLSLTGDKSLTAKFKLTVDEKTGLFSGLLSTGVEDPAIQIKTWKDLKKAFKRLDPQGKFSATLITDGGTIQLNMNPRNVSAVGSTFKLYILSSLEKAISERKLKWKDSFPIKEEWKSLPSGVMHTWPTGKPVSLYEYAENMISISDNTATDHLLYLLGRENVESMMISMGNSHVGNTPLLSTLEMFKLKWAIPPESTNEYLSATQEHKRKMLAELSKVSREAVGTNGVSLEEPTLIDELEWFATTQDNCKVMFNLAKTESQEVLTILSKSVPGITNLKQEESHWAYAGYKGGSEPGVISMTYLLESKNGTRACLSMTWNNPEKSVSAVRFQDLVLKTLTFSQSQVP